MCIEKTLISQDGKKIKSYLTGNQQAWVTRFKNSIKEIQHDEPWLTLVALYTLFSDQSNLDNKDRLKALEDLLANCGIKHPPLVSKIAKVEVERPFKEILSYRNTLQDIAKGNLTIHHYPDRLKHIIHIKNKNRASFEGNTRVDVFIEAIEGERPVYFFIEAKFLSDISYQISYSPVRDQISRIIDTGIDKIQELKNDGKIVDYHSLYFLMLTPRQFRTGLYGGNGNPPLQEFNPERSRLYCYKMNEFKDFKLLKAALPHRNNLTDAQWQEISANLGWITFEEIYHQATVHKTIIPAETIEIETFFKDRNLI